MDGCGDVAREACPATPASVHAEVGGRAAPRSLAAIGETVRYELIGRGLRALRHRRGLRQSDASALAGVARSVIADLEAGRLISHTVGALMQAAEAVGASIRIDLITPGGDLRRLLDADHAVLQGEWKRLLERNNWLVDAELTFNHYGERGSIDLFAWHPPTRTLVIIEIKTVIVDIQDLLSGIDRKVRIGRSVAAERGWRPQAVVPVLLVAEGSTARRRIGEHAALFSRFELRGRAGMAWLREPTARPAPTGVLCMTRSSNARSDDRRRAGRQRIRLRGPISRSRSVR